MVLRWRRFGLLRFACVAEFKSLCFLFLFSSPGTLFGLRLPVELRRRLAEAVLIASGAAMMMRRVAASLVPPWLEPLLSTNFFAACSLHPEAPRSECNMFCLDCGGATSSFCFCCRSDSHSGHCVIQIRRSSYHDVVRVAEIQKVLEISGVQTYVINSARVLFLNERPQPRGGGRGGGASSSSSPHICEICARSLLDPFRFCSLGCKLVGIKRNGDATFLLTPGDDEAVEGGGGSGGGESSTTAAAEESKGARRGSWVGGSSEGEGHDIRGPTPPPPPAAASRRRKGIPHRAPFAS